MRPIRMVDLKTQYEKIKPEVDAAIHEVIDTTSFINGPAVQRFQKNLEQYLGVKHVIPCANGTDALQVSMMALDLKPGDEVITVSFTFVATVEVIALLKLTPILVDVEPGTFNMDIEALKKAITPKTKAIVPVHLFGQSANMEPIMEIAREHNLFVIEDNCQAIGSDYTFRTDRRKRPERSDMSAQHPSSRRKTLAVTATAALSSPTMTPWPHACAISSTMGCTSGITTTRSA